MTVKWKQLYIMWTDVHCSRTCILKPQTTDGMCSRPHVFQINMKVIVTGVILMKPIAKRRSIKPERMYFFRKKTALAVICIKRHKILELSSEEKIQNVIFGMEIT